MSHRLQRDEKLDFEVDSLKGKGFYDLISLVNTLIPKKKIEISREYIKSIGRGIGYTKTAFAYIFRKTQRRLKVTGKIYCLIIYSH